MNKSKLIDSIFKEILESQRVPYNDNDPTGDVASIYGNDIDTLRHVDLEEEEEEFYESLFEEFENNERQRKRIREDEAPLSADTSQSMTLNLPRFTPTESWGRPDSDSFRRIKPFIMKAVGAERDIDTKFKNLMRPFQSKSAIKSPGRMISSLVLIESLASCMKDFTESPTGFVFEGFLAALTFGRQVTEKTPSGLPIEDIIAYSQNGGEDGVPASLKVLKGRAVRKKLKGTGTTAIKGHEGTGIHGSWQNLIRFFDRYDTIEYIVALKRGSGSDKLQILAFRMNRDNFIDILDATGNSHLFGAQEEEIRKVKNDWKRLRPLLWAAIGQDGGEDPDNVKKVDARNPKKVKPGEEGFIDTEYDDLGRKLDREGNPIINEGKETQWSIEQKHLKLLQSQNADFRQVAELDLSTASLQKMTEAIAARLGENVKKLFKDVADMSEGINSYFTEENRATARTTGNDAALTANEIGTDMTGVVEDEDKSGGETAADKEYS